MIRIDISLRRSPRRYHRNDKRNSLSNRPHWQSQSHTPRNQYANWRAIYPTDKHPSTGLGIRCARAAMGRAPVRSGLSSCQKLPGNGSESWTFDGKIKRHCGFIGRVEGSANAYAWRVLGVDRHRSYCGRDCCRSCEYYCRFVCWG